MMTCMGMNIPMYVYCTRVQCMCTKSRVSGRGLCEPHIRQDPSPTAASPDLGKKQLSGRIDWSWA